MNTTTSYVICSPYLTIHDRASRRRIDFEASQGEYFASLAASLQAIEEKLATIKDEGRSWYATSQELAWLKQTREDLAYLQANYDLAPKPKASFWDYL